jgi:endonuclease III
MVWYEILPTQMRHSQKAIDDKKDYLSRIREILVPLWPDAKPLLQYSSCFELLCSVILSAQCTDEQVNAVTPRLFKAYPDAPALAAAEPEDVEGYIRTVGFFHTKARHLVLTARMLKQNFGGKVPSGMEDLLSLPGVGRKTANLVASACFGVPGIIVDTHVMRVAFRLGIHGKKDPAEIEMTIRDNVEERYYTAFSHALNRHGKFVCKARAPACLVAGHERIASHARIAASPAGTIAYPSCPLEAFCPKIGLYKN